MKQRRAFILIYLCIICFLSCTAPYPNSILRVENIIKENPDSALVLLDSLKESITKEPQSTKMYYYLLLIEARDRCYVPHTSDSLILSITNYYEGEKDRDKLMKSYYYTGRVYLDLHDNNTALSYLHKALDTSTNSKDYPLIGRIYSQMGTLFAYEDLTEEVLQAYKKAYYYFQLGKDSLTCTYALRDIGRAFDLLEIPDSMLYYYNKAYKLAQTNKDKRREVSILQELANIYINMDKCDEALKVIQKMDVKWLDKADLNYGIWGDYYMKTGQMDSAIYYLKQDIGRNNIYTDAKVYQNLYRIEKERANYEKGLEYLEKYTECADSIYNESNTESLRKIKALYDFQHIEKEKEALRKKNAEQQAWIIFILIVIVLGTIILIQYNRNRKTKIREQENRLLEINEQLYRKSQQYIEENKKKIEDLNNKVEQAEQEKNDLQQKLILAKKEKLEQTIQTLETSRKEQELLEEALRKTDIYAHCYHAIEDLSIKLSEAEWKELENVVNETFDNFTKRLFIIHPSITKIELRICLLLKIKIPTSTISQLICRTQSAVSMSRKQLYKKIFNKEGTTADLDKFIIDF